MIKKNIASDYVIKVVQQGLRATVTQGTARSLNSNKTPIAGKTGTAQFGIEGRVHSWFVSYAPFDDPEIAVVVLVENQIDKLGSSTVPVAREFYNWYFNERGLELEIEEE